MMTRRLTILLVTCAMVAATMAAPSSSPTAVAKAFEGSYAPSGDCQPSAACCCATGPIQVTMDDSNGDTLSLSSEVDGGTGCHGQEELSGTFSVDKTTKTATLSVPGVVSLTLASNDNNNNQEKVNEISISSTNGGPRGATCIQYGRRSNGQQSSTPSSSSSGGPSSSSSSIPSALSWMNLPSLGSLGGNFGSIPSPSSYLPQLNTLQNPPVLPSPISSATTSTASSSSSSVAQQSTPSLPPSLSRPQQPQQQPQPFPQTTTPAVSPFPSSFYRPQQPQQLQPLQQSQQPFGLPLSSSTVGRSGSHINNNNNQPDMRPYATNPYSMNANANMLSQQQYQPQQYPYQGNPFMMPSPTTTTTGGGTNPFMMPAATPTIGGAGGHFNPEMMMTMNQQQQQQVQFQQQQVQQAMLRNIAPFASSLSPSSSSSPSSSPSMPSNRMPMQMPTFSNSYPQFEMAAMPSATSGARGAATTMPIRPIMH